MSNKNKKPVDKKEEAPTMDKAIFLLLQARRGIQVIIGGTGPYNDQVSGVYYQAHDTGDGDRFLLSQWNDELEAYLKEVGHES